MTDPSPEAPPRIPLRQAFPCSECGGSGKVLSSPLNRAIRRRIARSKERRPVQQGPCPTCRGRGSIVDIVG